jgi:hypothetical protein
MYQRLISLISYFTKDHIFQQQGFHIHGTIQEHNPCVFKISIKFVIGVKSCHENFSLVCAGSI